MKRRSFRARVTAFFLLWLSGCVTAPRPDLNNYGRYPENYESIVEGVVQASPEPPPNTTRTVTSVTEPIRQTRGEIAGWGVWGKVRLARTNSAGGIEIEERDYFFLLRDGKVVLSDYTTRK